jgi:2-polyprenyl-3-methyl-5-hydroxy-6-metoxy-1,4-benzoquinol methylase
MTAAPTSHHERTLVYFRREAPYWRQVYGQAGLEGVVYRARMERALAWADDLRLAPGAAVLEVGCGAGLATVELARRGFAVECTDSVSEMVGMASRVVAEAGLRDAVSFRLADAHDLPHASGSFELVLALGVLPWLHAPQHALRELARIVAPGGHVIVSADNRQRLNAALDPVEQPLLAPVRSARHTVERRLGRPPPAVSERRDRPAQVDRWLRAAGFEVERRTTVGFGPFTFLWRVPFSESTGLRLHSALDRLAARRLPRLRRHGWHYLVLARRV